MQSASKLVYQPISKEQLAGIKYSKGDGIILLHIRYR